MSSRSEPRLPTGVPMQPPSLSGTDMTKTTRKRGQPATVSLLSACAWGLLALGLLSALVSATALGALYLLGLSLGLLGLR